MQTIITIQVDSENPPVIHGDHHLISSSISSRSFEKGRVLYNAGAAAGFAYIIKSGTIQLEGESFSRTISEGLIFGEEALLGQPYSYTATALSECTVGIIGAHEFSTSLGSVARQVVEALVRSSGDAMTDRGKAQVSNLKTRLANLLNRMVEDEGEEFEDGWFRIKRKPTHNSIAFAIGAKRSTITVYLSRMRKHGVLNDDGETLDIHRKGMLDYLSK